MRNFEERRAEIFRRSENRIKERKRNRSRILALCIPLCITLAVCSVVFLPNTRHKAVSDANAENAPYAETENAVNYESVVIAVGAENKKIADPDKIAAINSAVSDLFGWANTDEGADLEDNAETQTGDTSADVQSAGGGTKGENYSAENSSTGVQYTICLTDAEGTETQLVLKNSELVNVQSGEKIQLTEKQTEEFLSLLEIK